MSDRRPPGMLPAAYDRYIHCCKEVEVTPPRISQTIGKAKASAGYHHADGEFVNETGHKARYCAASDLSLKRPTVLSGDEISRLLLSLFHGDFIPFWRPAGMAGPSAHIHMIWPDCEMKPELQRQVKDFVYGRNGLKGHGPDIFGVVM